MNFLYVIEVGGVVSIALLCVSVALWVVVYRRYLLLRGGEAGCGVVTRFRHRLSQLHAYRFRNNRTKRADALFADTEVRLSTGRDLLTSLVVVAPLLGLLGTVGGMIETFDTLHVAGLAHSDASVSGGISKALLTTQLGMVVAIPGLLFARGLEKLEQRQRQVAQTVHQNFVIEVRSRRVRQ